MLLYITFTAGFIMGVIGAVIYHYTGPGHSVPREGPADPPYYSGGVSEEWSDVHHPLYRGHFPGGGTYKTGDDLEREARRRGGSGIGSTGGGGGSG